MKENVSLDSLYPKSRRQNYTFYYDESNNIRKLLLKNGCLSSSSLKRYFVLGGLVLKNGQSISTTNLHDIFKLQKTVNEIKFKNFCDSREFPLVVSSWRIQQYFKWLVSNRCLIHFSIMDWVYYSLVDIVDSLPEEKEEIYLVESLGLPLKTALYDAVNPDMDAFMGFLSDFDYPNVSPLQKKPFLDGLLAFATKGKINVCSDELPFLQYLFFLIQKAKDHSSLPFIQDNDPQRLIDSFGVNYIQPIKMFPKCKHVFDIETSIVAEVRDTCGGCTDYSFIDSKDCVFVQLSDVFVGFLISGLDYARLHTELEISSFIGCLSSKEKEVLENMCLLIDKSNRFSKFTINKIIPITACKKARLLFGSF
jgi:hypothetical protein